MTNEIRSHVRSDAEVAGVTGERVSNRPPDWHILDLDHDPTPGDPQRVRRLAGSLHDFSDDVADILRDVKGLANDDAVLKWAGKTADSFASEFEDAAEGGQGAARRQPGPPGPVHGADLAVGRRRLGAHRHHEGRLLRPGHGVGGVDSIAGRFPGRPPSDEVLIPGVAY
ncbi:hypothetical protein [Streptomyces sp. NPDC096324]|uniref:hypothetical protein n=1 Tax=Streptomyces sp. NPDC096324 TaxID=3366085 RepID=UPI0038129503